jgi:hypothetical protein
LFHLFKPSSVIIPSSFSFASLLISSAIDIDWVRAFRVGEEFHACLEDTNKVITLACYELKNTEKQAPEKLTIDFNSFP